MSTRELHTAASAIAGIVTALHTPEERRLALLAFLCHYRDRRGFEPRELYALAAIYAREPWLEASPAGLRGPSAELGRPSARVGRAPDGSSPHFGLWLAPIKTMSSTAVPPRPP